MTFALRVIQVWEVASVDDFFRCDPLHATMTAGACAQRQAEARRGGGVSGDGLRGISSEHLTMCVDCKVGKEVEKKVGKATSKAKKRNERAGQQRHARRDGRCSLCGKSGHTKTSCHRR